MPTPTQQIIQRGSFANDGTGDTLRDAGQKINDNFTYLWDAVYASEDLYPGRKFVCASISTSTPDSGEFTLSNANLRDSGQYFRISRYDQAERSYKISTDSAGLSGLDLSIWSLDSGTTNDWNLLAKFGGNVQYTNDTWVFQRTSTYLATTDGVDSGGTYYIKLDGAW
jgi:hypothetical protein